MQKSLPWIALAIASVALVLTLLPHEPAAPTAGNIGDASIFTISNTATVNVTTSSGQVVATSTSRRLLLVQNDDSNKVYCSFNGKAGVDKQGFAMLASTTYEFSGNKLYTGALNCIASSTTRLLVTESY